MKLFLPATWAELWELNGRYPERLLMAGGTDLLVKLRQDADSFPTLIGLERLAPLQEISADDAGLTIGAAVTCQRLLDDQRVKNRLPALWQALSLLGSPPLRHAATLGGNLCTASPAGDTLPPLYIMGAQILLRSATQTRQLPIGEFILGPGRTALQSGELVSGVMIPWPADNTSMAYEKVGRRQALAVSLVSLALAVEWGAGLVVADVRLAWGSVGPTVVRLPAVENILRGNILTAERLRQAADIASAGVSAIDDLRAGAAYRRQLAGGLLQRVGARLLAEREIVV